MRISEEIRALVTGGAGFVGCNYTWHLLDKGCKVVVYDNFARGAGCLQNTKWLASHPNSANLTIVRGHVQNYDGLFKAGHECDLIVHAAAQVSVPLSISDPKLDFQSNALGTFNVLEVARNLGTDPIVVYLSSNKVYGIPEAELIELENRYDFKDLPNGVHESFPLKGEEPYGVSKGIGDYYIRAYHLRYGLKAVSFRCSCMYGPRQWGKEEQGWVGWFCIAAATNKTITIFGDGKQVRDLLYVDDVIHAFDSAVKRIDKVAGEGINLGGGRENAISLLEAIAFLEQLTGKSVPLRFADWRPGDNKCYYTNNVKATRLLGWRPTIPWKEGIHRTYNWVTENISHFIS